MKKILFGTAAIVLVLIGAWAIYLLWSPRMIYSFSYEVNEKSLAKFCDTAFVVSPDFQHVAWVEIAGEKEWAVLDGKPGKKYDEIRTFSKKVSFGKGPFGRFPIISFSTDGSRYAYGAKEKNAWRMVVDGKEEGKWDSFGHFEFSPDERRYGYSATRVGKRYIVIDGQPFGPYEFSKAEEVRPDLDFSFWILPFFSGNSQHVAWIGGRNGNIFAVLDGVEGQPVLGSIEAALFSPDSEMLAYKIISKNKEQETSQRIWSVRKGTSETKLENVEEFQFAPQGHRYAYTIARKDSWELFTDKGLVVRNTLKDKFSWKEDGESLIYVEITAQGRKVVNGSLSWPVYQDIMQMVTSRDGKHILWITSEGKGKSVFVDGQEIVTGTDVEWVCFCGLDQLPWIALKEGENRSLFYKGIRSRKFQNLTKLTFSKDGRAACFGFVTEEKEGKVTNTAVLLLDGIEIAQLPCELSSSGLPDVSELQFTCDGKHVVGYLHSKGYVLLWDGKEIFRHSNLLKNYNDITILGLKALGGWAYTFRNKVRPDIFLQAFPDAESAMYLSNFSDMAQSLGLVNSYDWTGRFIAGIECSSFCITQDGIWRGILREESQERIKISLVSRKLE